MLFLLLLRPPPRSTLFPYTTLFRSKDLQAILSAAQLLILKQVRRVCLASTEAAQRRERMPFLPPMLETAIVGAGPYGLSVAAHFRHLGVPFRIFGRPMDSWLAHMPKGMMLKPDGFLLRLEDGEVVRTRRVVLAVGITHFAHIPRELAHLPKEFLSHSFEHHNLEPFRGKSVVVIGGGASATDLAGLLRDTDADVQLVARQTSLNFHNKQAVDKPRSWWQRMRHPQSGIGPGWRSRFLADAPMAFHYLPQSFRLKTVRTYLGPSGGWFAKDKVMGRVPLLLGYTPKRAEIQDGRVRLELRAADGSKREILTEHIIAATGYKVNLKRLPFLSPEIRSKIKAVDGTPVLSSSFESSVPGLYFAGVAAANSFGPVMRFPFGAGFAARRLTRALAKSLDRKSTRLNSSHTVISYAVSSFKK